MSPIARANSQSQVIVLSILHDGLSPTQAAERFGVGRTWIYQLLVRYKAGGLEALEPGSRKPKSNPRALTGEKRNEIIGLRRDLLSQGLDAGAASIAWHIEQGDANHQLSPPSGASCAQKVWWLRSQRSDPRHTSPALKQCNRMKPGNQISPIGDFAMAQMSRSSTGSMITLACFCIAQSLKPSLEKLLSIPSIPVEMSMGHRFLLLPIMAMSIPPGSPKARMDLNICSPS